LSSQLTKLPVTTSVEPFPSTQQFQIVCHPLGTIRLLVIVIDREVVPSLVKIRENISDLYTNRIVI